MSSIRRQRKVADLIHKEVSNLLQFEIKDPRVSFVTVTDAEISGDFSIATIYVSIMNEDEKEVLAGLNSAAPFLRYQLGRRVRLRHTPELHFKVDRSIAYAQKIESILSDIDIPPEVEPESDENDLLAQAKPNTDIDNAPQT